jgi:hypothetical protein
MVLLLYYHSTVCSTIVPKKTGYYGTTARYYLVPARVTNYHVTYTDGDEEEMSQTELRDAYVLGLREEINREWKKYKSSLKKNTVEDSEGSEVEISDGEVETSDGEGSEYDKADYNAEVKNNKRKRKESKKSSTKKKQTELSGCVLPTPGEKTVAAEAYDKLSESQKQLVVDKVNRKTKKVDFLKHFFITITNRVLYVWIIDYR